MTDLKAYELAHQTAAVFDRNSCVKIGVSGSDHLSFLHNILSQDILGMRTGEWRQAALLSATSHVLAYMHILRMDFSVILISAPGTYEKARKLLDKFIIAEDVQISDVSKKWDLLEIWGPRAGEIAEKSTKKVFFSDSEGQPLQRMLVLDHANEKNVTGASHDNAAREILRIENGILEFGPDINETIMLSETRLEKKSASETKGCYPGQEVVAKIETYKRLNRSFVRFDWTSKDLPDAGAIICKFAGGVEIGRLTSRAYSPFYQKTVGLGWLKRGFFEQPVEVSIKSKTAIPAHMTLF